VVRRADYKRGFHQRDEDFQATLAELSGFPGVRPMILQAKTQMIGKTNVGRFIPQTPS
jgi:hypothetical protein